MYGVDLSTLCSSSLHYKEFGCHIKGYPLLSKLAEHNVLKPSMETALFVFLYMSVALQCYFDHAQCLGCYMLNISVSIGLDTMVIVIVHVHLIHWRGRAGIKFNISVVQM